MSPVRLENKSIHLSLDVILYPIIEIIMGDCLLKKNPAFKNINLQHGHHPQIFRSDSDRIDIFVAGDKVVNYISGKTKINI